MTNASDEVEARRRAVMALSAAGASAALEIVAFLGDADWRVRKEAVRVLAATRQMPEQLVSALLQGDNVGLRHGALDVCEQLGVAALPVLRAALGHVTGPGRKFVVQAVGAAAQGSRDPQVVALLEGLARDADPNLAITAIEAIARVTGPDAERALRGVLEKGGPHARIGALDGLDRLDAHLRFEEISVLLGDRVTRRMALRALGRTGSTEALPVLLDALDDPSPRAVEDATGALARLVGGLDADVRERFGEGHRYRLRELLAQAEGATRDAAALLLVHLRDARALPAVLSAAAERDLPPPVGAALRAWGGALAEELVSLLEPEGELSPEARAIGLQLAADLAEGDALSSAVRGRLRAALGDMPAVAIAAALGLRKLAEPIDAARLVSAALRGDETLARASSQALERLAQVDASAVDAALEAVGPFTEAPPGLVTVAALCGGERLLGRLEAALSSDEPPVRRAAVEAIARTGGSRAAQLVGYALADESVDVRIAAASALGVVRDASGALAGYDPLILALGSDVGAVRAAAARALGVLGDPRAIGPLHDAVHDADSTATAPALEALRTLGDPHVEELLHALADHSDPEVAKQALRGMAQNHPAAAEARLAHALSHPHWDVRSVAVELLARVGAPTARAALEAHLEQEDDDLVRSQITEALAQFARGAA